MAVFIRYRANDNLLSWEDSDEKHVDGERVKGCCACRITVPGLPRPSALI